MQTINNLLKDKKQLLFTRTIQPNFEKIFLKMQTEILVNNKVGSCIRIHFVANNIYCTF